MFLCGLNKIDDLETNTTFCNYFDFVNANLPNIKSETENVANICRNTIFMHYTCINMNLNKLSSSDDSMTWIKDRFVL